MEVFKDFTKDMVIYLGVFLIIRGVISLTKSSKVPKVLRYILLVIGIIVDLIINVLLILVVIAMFREKEILVGVIMTVVALTVIIMPVTVGKEIFKSLKKEANNG